MKSSVVALAGLTLFSTAVALGQTPPSAPPSPAATSGPSAPASAGVPSPAATAPESPVPSPSATPPTPAATPQDRYELSTPKGWTVHRVPMQFGPFAALQLYSSISRVGENIIVGFVPLPPGTPQDNERFGRAVVNGAQKIAGAKNVKVSRSARSCGGKRAAWYYEVLLPIGDRAFYQTGFVEEGAHDGFVALYTRQASSKPDAVALRALQSLCVR